MSQEKVINFLKERNIKRKEALNIFNSLHLEDKYHLLQEYDHAKADPRIIIRGGKFEDFLIREFKLKISLYEEMKSVHRMEMRLKKIISDLEEIIYKLKKYEIDSADFIKTYRASEIELKAIDLELKSLMAAN